MCFFVGPVVAAPHLGDQIPKPLFLGSLIGFFKPNVQNYYYNTTASIPTIFCTTLKTIKTVLIVGGPNTPPTNLKWQTAAILESFIAVYPQSFDRF